MAYEPFSRALAADSITPARVYNYYIGGKDHFAPDREAGLSAAAQYPEVIDVARENRMFLDRVVRFLARDEGIAQYLDLGSGLPGSTNVHDIAQKFIPEARVSYVDHDPIVLAHGRALLTPNERVMVVEGDVAHPEQVLNTLVAYNQLDLGEPAAVLLLSVPQFVPDDQRIREVLEYYWESLAPGSYLALSQVATLAKDEAERMNSFVTTRFKVGWKTRVPEAVDHYLGRWVAVDPGLGDIGGWRPDPTQPLIKRIDERGQRFLGASLRQKLMFEYGGLLHKPR